MPLPVASALVATTLFPAATSQKLGAVCVTLCADGTSCNGTPPPGACEASSRDVRSLSDFVDKSLPQLLIANGIALANGQPPQFSLPPIVASSQVDITVRYSFGPEQLLLVLRDFASQSVAELKAGRVPSFAIPYRLEGTVWFDAGFDWPHRDRVGTRAGRLDAADRRHRRHGRPRRQHLRGASVRCGRSARRAAISRRDASAWCAPVPGGCTADRSLSGRFSVFLELEFGVAAGPRSERGVTRKSRLAPPGTALASADWTAVARRSASALRSSSSTRVLPSISSPSPRAGASCRSRAVLGLGELLRLVGRFEQ